MQFEQEGLCPSHFCFRFLHRWQARATRERLILLWTAGGEAAMGPFWLVIEGI